MAARLAYAMKLNDGRVLTISLAVTSLLVVAVSTLIFPTFIVGKTDSDGPRVCDFATLWEENKLALPQLSQWGVAFSKAKNKRTVWVTVFFILTLIIEIFIKSRRLAGGFPLFTLLCGIMISWFVLASAFLPYMPLCP